MSCITTWEAQSYVGRTILVGITWCDCDDSITEQEQFAGTVAEVSPAEHVMAVDTAEGQWHLPVYLHDVLKAPGGIYKCVSSGEVVEDPDLLASWRVTASRDLDGLSRWTSNCAPFSDSINPPDWEHEYRPDLDYIRKRAEEMGHQYVGKYVLIGERHYAHDGDQVKFIRQRQLHGYIERVSPDMGIIVRLSNGSEYRLPSDLSLLEPAAREEYKLTSTGEVVKNPDFITTWAVHGGKELQPGEA